jgi:hypothetical protein
MKIIKRLSLMVGLTLLIASSIQTTAQYIDPITLVSKGVQATATGRRPVISHNGRYVAFDGRLGPYSSVSSAVFVYDRQTGITKEISVNANGDSANGEWTANPSISADGQIIAFYSNATNLVPNDTNGVGDIFVYNMQTDDLTRVSVDSSGNQANNGVSFISGLSGDGQLVMFSSFASNLVPNDTNNISDVFVHNRTTGETTRVSVSSLGEQANEINMYSGVNGESISSDGRYVSFTSDSSTLVLDDTNNTYDVFVHDRQLATTIRVSVDSNGNQITQGFSGGSHLSADGQKVVFTSYSSQLVPNDTNSVEDIFLHDIPTGITTRISESNTGVQGNAESSEARISLDGRYAIIRSSANNLDPIINTSGILVRDLQLGTTEMVTLTSSGVNGNQRSYLEGHGNVMSSDGRFVVFSTDATNFSVGDVNNRMDVYIRDLQTDTTELISVGDGLIGTGNSDSYAPSLSSDGRYTAFISYATNLIANDTNGFSDAYVYDAVTEVMSRVSVSSGGTQANSLTNEVAISGDGQYVAFISAASNLVAGDTNTMNDVFVHDRTTGNTVRVSLSSIGTQANGNSQKPDISADGRYVVFSSYASNLVTGDTNNTSDIFVHDRQTSITTRVSVDSIGNQANSSSQHVAISGDGRYIAFSSNASNLVVGDTNTYIDVFVHDRTTGETIRVSVNSIGEQANLASSSRLDISADGRYVVFGSLANNLVVSDTNNEQDIFMYDRQTQITSRVSVNSLGQEANNWSINPTISGDGAYIAYVSPATNLGSDRDSDPPMVDLFVYAPATGTTQYVGPTAWDYPATYYETLSAISNDGQVVTFESLDNSIVWNDYNVDTDIFMRQLSQPYIIPAPILIAPNDLATITSTPFEMSWNIVPEATSYSVQLATDSNFTNIVNTVSVSIGTSTQYWSGSGTYYWRVRGVTGMDNGIWSVVRQFTIEALPAPNLVAPADNFSTTNPDVDFSWDAVNTATSYQIQIADGNDFSTIVHDQTVNTLSHTHQLTISDVYYWRVRGIGNTGYGTWSAVRQFTIEALPAPTLVAPTDNFLTTNPDVDFSWDAVNTATNYQIQIADDNDFSTIVHDQTVNTLSHTHQLAIPDVYYWRVRGIGNTGNGTWSVVRQFTIEALPAPNLVAPTDNFLTTNPEVNFSWDAVNTATSYQIQIADSNDFSTIVHDQTVTTLLHTHQLTIPDVYYWRVRGIGSTGNGTWSVVRQFTIEALPAPNLVAPTDNFLTTNPDVDFSWDAVNTATNYQIQIADSNDFSTIVHDQTVNTLSHTHQLTIPDVYYWRVRGIGSTGNGTWSVVRQFTLIPVTYTQEQIVDEQDLFNLAQSHLPADMTFALFDTTPTSIITTVQFSDGGVVTATINMSITNGLITITLNGVSGGSALQQEAMYQHMPTLIMTILDEVLPDDYISLESVILTDTTIQVTVLRPN